jgi:hypothetical protein
MSVLLKDKELFMAKDQNHISFDFNLFIDCMENSENKNSELLLNLDECYPNDGKYYYHSVFNWFNTFSKLYSLHSVDLHDLLNKNQLINELNFGDIKGTTKDEFEISAIEALDYNINIKLKWLFEHNKLPDIYSIILSELAEEYEKTFQNLMYLPSIKGFQKRVYYSYDDNILNNLIKQFTEINIHKQIVEFLSFWLNEFGIGTNLEITRNPQLDIEYILIDGRSLLDMGFGVSQVTGILLSIAILASKNAHIFLEEQHVPFYFSTTSGVTLILEEPESNLHPKLQSKLADLILDAAKKFNIQFIIETHSEYLIRKLQFLTAKEELPINGTVIYYFYEPSKKPVKEPLIKKINILKDGSLSDEFGVGFFDEAINLKLELLKHKNIKKN